MTRVFADEPLATGRELRLGPGAAAHVSRVLRLATGAELTLFDGRGGEYLATIIESRGTLVRVQVGEHRPIERESPLRITLAQGVARGERMDWVVQKATELGVAAIVPLLTERSVVRLEAAQLRRKREHWRGIVIGACEQSGRNQLPELAAPLPLGQWLEGLSGDGAQILLDPTARAGLPSIGQTTSVTLLIGPEGGLTPAEHALAARGGFTSMRLGPRILRTETAALAAIGVLQATRGDLA